MLVFIIEKYYIVIMLRLLVFAALLGQFTAYGSSCNYKKILKRYEESCKRKQYLGDIFTDLETGGEIKSGVFLERLTSTCSNYAEYSKCANCTAKHICPEEQDKLREILAERWSIFCDGDQPASWLTTILQNGFSYNVTCFYIFLEGFFSCMPQKPPERSSNDTSLSSVVDMHRNLRQDMFSCSLNGILKNGNGGCGSSWQDILLTNWLMTSLKFYKLFYIGTEEIKQLQDPPPFHIVLNAKKDIEVNHINIKRLYNSMQSDVTYDYALNEKTMDGSE